PSLHDALPIFRERIGLGHDVCFGRMETAQIGINLDSAKKTIRRKGEAELLLTRLILDVVERKTFKILLDCFERPRPPRWQDGMAVDIAVLNHEVIPRTQHLPQGQHLAKNMLLAVIAVQNGKHRPTKLSAQRLYASNHGGIYRRTLHELDSGCRRHRWTEQ